METLRPNHTDTTSNLPPQRWEKQNPIGERPIIIVAFGEDAKQKSSPNPTPTSTT